MRIKGILISMCIILCSLGLSAQQFHTPHTQYLYNPYIFNPARAGFGDGYPRVFMNYRKQWVEMPDSPNTKIITADGRLGSKRKRVAGEHPFDDVGVGGIFYQDNTFAIQRVGGVFSYAYHFLPEPNTLDIEKYKSRYHQFSMGLSTGFLSQSIDYDQIRVQHMNDDVLFAGEVSQTVFDLGFGMAYQYHTEKRKKKKIFETLNADLAIIHAPGSKIRYFNGDGSQFDDNEDVKNYQLLTHFIGGINMDLHINHLRGSNANFYLKPGMLVRAASGKPVQFDFSLLTKFDLRDTVNVVFGGGVKTSPENPVVGIFTTVGLQLTRSASIYYNFETIHEQVLGVSHEIMVGYTFGRKFKKRFDEIDTIAKKNKENILSNRDAITKNKISIIENNHDIDAIILSEFKEDYRNHRQNGLYRYISQEKILERITKPIDFTGLSNVKTENIQKALEDENVYQSKVEDGLPERIYVVAHYFSQDADLTEADMTAIRSRVEEALINIGFSPDIIHSFTISEQDKDLKNHISILGRYPKE